jgi:hypothetical protein
MTFFGTFLQVADSHVTKFIIFLQLSYNFFMKEDEIHDMLHPAFLAIYYN